MKDQLAAVNYHRNWSITAVGCTLYCYTPNIAKRSILSDKFIAAFPQSVRFSLLKTNNEKSILVLRTMLSLMTSFLCESIFFQRLKFESEQSVDIIKKKRNIKFRYCLNAIQFINYVEAPPISYNQTHKFIIKRTKCERHIEKKNLLKSLGVNRQKRRRKMK